LVAWTANIAHWSDVGGMAPGSISTEAREIFQEGLRLPAVKLIEEGKPLEPVLAIVEANSRLPDSLRGDLWAGIAAVRVGERRLRHRGADPLPERHRPARPRERRLAPAAARSHATGLGLRRISARRVRHLLRGSDAALRPHVALPGAAPRRAAPGRSLRIDLRHLHR